MSILFNIFKEEEVTDRNGEKFNVRLLNKDDDWGVDTTKHMEPIFGYSRIGAENVYRKIIGSYKNI